MSKGFQIPKLNLNKVLGNGATKATALPPLFADAATSPVHQLMTAKAQVSETVELTACKDKKPDMANAVSSVKTKSHRKSHHQASKSLSSAKLCSPQGSRHQSPKPLVQANSISFVATA